MVPKIYRDLSTVASLSRDINLSFENYITNMPNHRFQKDNTTIWQQQVRHHSSKISKGCFCCYAYPLSEIFSQSLATGIFPDNLKVARISAIYKGKGSRSNPDNYRPISLLSVVSRLSEKLVHEQLYSYIKDSLSKTQSGFKPGHSTKRAF